MKSGKIQVLKALALLVGLNLIPLAHSAEIVEETNNCDWQALNPADPTAIPLVQGSAVTEKKPGGAESGTLQDGTPPPVVTPAAKGKTPPPVRKKR